MKHRFVGISRFDSGPMLNQHFDSRLSQSFAVAGSYGHAPFPRERFAGSSNYGGQQSLRFMLKTVISQLRTCDLAFSLWRVDIIATKSVMTSLVCQS